MQSTLKLLPALLMVMNLTNIYAQPGAVVEDRSILLDSDLNSLSQKRNTNKFSNNFQNLPQNKLAYNSPQSDRPVVKYIDENKSFADDSDPVDLESVSKDYKPEIAVNRESPGANVNSGNTPEPEQYNQEIMIPNGAPGQQGIRDNSLFEDNAPEQQMAKENTLKELQSLPLNARLNRMENIIESQKGTAVESKMILLQEEVQRLRGVVESQKHELEKSLAQQKLMVEDLERRFSQGVAKDKPGATSQPISSSTSGSSPKSSGYIDDKSNQQDLYTEAYSNIKTKNYAKAISLFNKYITDYPSGLFSANSNYWLGEIYMIQSDYTKALVAFDNVLNKFPKNAKSADALYKKGLIHIYLKDFSKAKTYLSEVKTQYHDTTAARLADQELQNIEKINTDA